MCREANLSVEAFNFLQAVNELDEPIKQHPSYSYEQKAKTLNNAKTDSVARPQLVVKPILSGINDKRYLDIIDKPDFVKLLRQQMDAEEEELKLSDQIVEECKKRYRYDEISKEFVNDEKPETSFTASTSRTKLDHRCIVCSETFASRQVMIRHVQRKHPERVDDAKENRVYREGSSLQFRCSLCSKSFAKHAALVCHEKRHVAERIHACTFPGCKKSYAQPSELRKHAKRVHKMDH